MANYITNLQKENERLNHRIIKALHLMGHVEEYDYRVFIERLENILKGE